MAVTINLGLVATAGGTADAITATFNPPITALTDKLKVWVVTTAGANTATNPTFSPNGLLAHTITKTGAVALLAGDIQGSGHVLSLEYNSTTGFWELLNPARLSASDLNGLFAATMALVLTGFAAGANSTVLATDTLAQALAKYQGQINARPQTGADTTYAFRANNLSDLASAATARNNILPSKAGNTLKVLRVNAGETDYELTTISAGLTVTTKNINYTAVNGDLIVYDTNGANRTVTLPVGAVVDQRFGVYLKTVTSNFTVTITGLDVLYIAGDYVVYQYDGANWLKTAERLQPHMAEMSRNAAQSITISTVTKVLLDTVTNDKGVLTDIATSTFVIRRSGDYLVAWGGGLTMNDGTVLAIYAYKNTTTLVGYENRYGATGGAFLHIADAVKLVLVAGDVMHMSIYNNSSTQNTPTASNERPYMALIELR